VDKKADTLRLMSASPMCCRHMDACAGHMASGLHSLYLLYLLSAKIVMVYIL